MGCYGLNGTRDRAPPCHCLGVAGGRGRLTVGTLPELGPVLAMDVGLIVILDGVSQRELLSEVVTNLWLLPGGSVESLASLTNTCRIGTSK